MAAWRETAARLAAGSRGRTEADIQADIRTFLLEAPLELDNADLVDVALEAPAGGGRRIDIEAGCAAVEVKKSLSSKTVFDAAVKQLTGYVWQRTGERGQRYVGVLTDGRSWLLFHLTPEGELAQVAEFKLRAAADAPALASWLEAVLATTSKVSPTPSEIVRRLGAQSPAAQLDLADLRAMYEASKHQPEVQLKRELWARLLLAALGTNFDDSDELFVTHTYLVLVAELVAHEIMGLSVELADNDLRALLEGQRFAIAGLHGVVEADFFDWPAAAPDGPAVIAGVARRLGRFDWSNVDHDVLKALYESVIDSETRRRLGEYYTPDWLAQKMVESQFEDPLKQRLLDPACGSGTFLFWAIRAFLRACDAAGLPNQEALERVVAQVQGMDLHPVAVTLARVTYLLAVTPERLADRGELTVPVFLGDSVRWEQPDTVITDRGMTVRTSDDLELFEDQLHFPESLIEEPQRFDRLVAALATRAADRRPGTKPPGIAGLMKAHRVAGEEDREAVELVFKKLCRLHDAGRDHLWSYYIRNLARPLAFSRPEGRADVLVGNPPWLAFRHMTDNLQMTYRTLAEHRGLWAGGRGAANQDLSDLFVVRSVEQYLRPGGRFAFVMPHAVLSRFAYAGFRSACWPADTDEVTRVTFRPAEDFARIKPPPFPMPCCVIHGERSEVAAELPTARVAWAGEVRSHHLEWADVSTTLKRTVRATELASRGIGSPYRNRFRKGATLIPRVLVKVSERVAGPLGTPVSMISVESARAATEKEPWKSVPTLSGTVERRFVYPTHLGASILAFSAREMEQAVIPLVDGTILEGEDEHLDEWPGVATWWREAERQWEEHKSDSTRLSLRDQIDFQGKIRAQFPIPAQRVVYTTSGQHLAACRIDDRDAVIEQTLYWTKTETIDEGRYLCAILNSDVLAQAVAPLQARGQHNPRHFAMAVFTFPFPIFDPGNQGHVALARLGERAEEVAAAVDIDPTWHFQKSRRVVRQALREDGVSEAINRAVAALLQEAVTREGAAPDLMAALSAGIDAVRPQRVPAMRRSPPAKSRVTSSPS